MTSRRAAKRRKENPPDRPSMRRPAPTFSFELQQAGTDAAEAVRRMMARPCGLCAAGMDHCHDGLAIEHQDGVIECDACGDAGAVHRLVATCGLLEQCSRCA